MKAADKKAAEREIILIDLDCLDLPGGLLSPEILFFVQVR
jgi:hypothetical protein